jgi:hypothetical protein
MAPACSTAGGAREMDAEQVEVEAERAGERQQHGGAEAEPGEPAETGDDGGLRQDDRHHLVGVRSHRSQQADLAVALLHDRGEQQRDQDQQGDELQRDLECGRRRAGGAGGAEAGHRIGREGRAMHERAESERDEQAGAPHKCVRAAENGNVEHGTTPILSTSALPLVRRLGIAGCGRRGRARRITRD